jgi:hypothetical protein
MLLSAAQYAPGEALSVQRLQMTPPSERMAQAGPLLLLTLGRKTGGRLLLESHECTEQFRYQNVFLHELDPAHACCSDLQSLNILKRDVSSGMSQKLTANATKQNANKLLVGAAWLVFKTCGTVNGRRVARAHSL